MLSVVSLLSLVKKHKEKKQVVLLLVLTALISVSHIFLLFFFRKTNNTKTPLATQSPKCVIEEEIKKVRGNSLSGIIENEEEVSVLNGFYKCNKAERNDIILYEFGGSSNPLIKIIKGVPGDNLKLQETQGGWLILINGNPLKTSIGEPYIVNSQAFNMLSLYIKDYGGKIPDNTYLLLGNVPQGSLDSTRFGLVDQSDFIGKVIR